MGSAYGTHDLGPAMAEPIASPSGLASCGMAPELPLFVYDGDCGFCRKWAAWVEHKVVGGVTFVPYQSLDLLGLGLTAEEVQSASYWIDEQGRPFRGNRSFAKALRHSRGAWRGLGIVVDLPGVRVVAGVAYRWVVRNRHRLPAPGGE
jgi:predicted DCC family thiol-disulfide oxidoreductase YuxK